MEIIFGCEMKFFIRENLFQSLFRSQFHSKWNGCKNFLFLIKQSPIFIHFRFNFVNLKVTVAITNPVVDYFVQFIIFLFFPHFQYEIKKLHDLIVRQTLLLLQTFKDTPHVATLLRNPRPKCHHSFDIGCNKVFLKS